MKKIVYFILAIIIMLATTPITALGQEGSVVSKYLDKQLSDMVKEKQVKGAIITVVSNGTSELSKGFGFADEQKGIAADGENTAFHIGSISKTFVAIAAQQLVESGRLDMTASIYNYLEADFPKVKYRITMHDLLTHTAGFEDKLSGVAVNDIKKVEPLAVSIRKYMPDQAFTPGEVVSYSNYGIALAAYVVQCITGQDFYQYALDNIFKPLNMNKTTFELNYKGIEVSKAYTTKGEETIELLMNIYPEGSAISTATDMAKYIQWLLDDSNKVLSYKAKREMFDQQFTMSDEFEGIGYTWNRKIRNGVLYYNKEGETVNFCSRIVIYPGSKTGVFFSFNTLVGQDKLSTLMSEVTNLLLGKEKKVSLYKGKQTADISGYYVANRSAFSSMEKVMNFTKPDLVFNISGNLAEGFKLNGSKLKPKGENYYSTPKGDLKYIEKNGREYLVNNTAISYVSTQWYESSVVQMAILGLYLFVSIGMFVIGIMSIIRRKVRSLNRVFVSLYIINFALIISICVLFLIGVVNYSITNIEPFVSICGILIVGTSIFGIIYSVYSSLNKKSMISNILMIVWNFSNLLFCLWMLQVNIL